MARKVAALDCDGVLLNYHQAYGEAYARAFGGPLAVSNPNAYWPRDRWGIPLLSGRDLEYFRNQFNYEFWANIPPIKGALTACQKLCDAGYDLIVVSALEPEFQEARWTNLKRLGFPVSDVVATSSKSEDGESPKAPVIRMLRPTFFVDDFLPYMRGLASTTHLALVTREPDGSPNQGPELALVHSMHRDLASFTEWWLRREEQGPKPPKT